MAEIIVPGGKGEITPPGQRRGIQRRRKTGPDQVTSRRVRTHTDKTGQGNDGDGHQQEDTPRLICGQTVQDGQSADEPYDDSFGKFFHIIC